MNFTLREFSAELAIGIIAPSNIAGARASTVRAAYLGGHAKASA